MKSWTGQSLRLKLTVVLTGIAAVTLLVSMIYSGVRSVKRFSISLVEQEEGVAKVLAYNLGPVVAFGNNRRGGDVAGAGRAAPCAGGGVVADRAGWNCRAVCSV